VAESSVEMGAIFDEHMAAEFQRRDVDAAMATMTDNPYVNHVPVITGGVGAEEVRRFYGRHFIGKWPADADFQPISRTVGYEQVVDEVLISFTHDIEMDWLLPGVPPTGRFVRVPFCAVVKFEGDRIAHEHIYWDQASVLVQTGLLEPGQLPVAGAEQAEKLRDPRARPSNELIGRRRRS
jgi:carboxymethylenebutenolidase